ncbi:hypothetical protein M885DRAFT_555477 [Pelagophyceae sp. CCMP2097]|nr:hypothetical protein M885DRAFT_555477 [Pelagophyceae sp. CCMP2097]
MEQKCEIATLEHDRLVQDASDGRRASERLADTLRAVLEETDLRISELKKDAYEFKRDIVVGAENMRTGKTVAEKMIKYMEEKLRQRDSAIEKLRLKNSSLKAQLQKVEAQLKQKEEMGDVLHYIDFHQLQIENKQFQITIELRNKELLDLKLTTGKTVQALNALKGRLTTVEKESSQLTTDISLKNDQLKKVLDDSDGVANDVSLEQRARQRLGQAAAAQDAPSTMDYIAQKAAMYDLETLVKNWGRKCEILEMHAKRVRSQLRKEARTA